MFRFLAGGRNRDPLAQGNFHWGYLRAQSYHPLAAWASLHLDGRRAWAGACPCPAGTPVAAPPSWGAPPARVFFTPNFALARLGVPFRWPKPSASHLLGTEGDAATWRTRPAELREGTRVRPWASCCAGSGAILR